MKFTDRIAERLDRLVGGLRARRRLRFEVGVWYHDEYTFPSFGEPGVVQPRRGDLVMGRLVHDGFLSPTDVREPDRAPIEWLAEFHSWAYIESTTLPQTLARIFGVSPEELNVDDVLASVRRAVGGTVAAAESVAFGNLGVAVNLGGGFHHAEPEMGSGFCVYNDVGVAIRRLRRLGYEGTILIVDLDVHQGNGNSVAFDSEDRVKVYSIHGSRWNRLDSGEHVEIHLRARVDDRRYMSVLRTTLEPLMRRLRPDLVFFVAGADVLQEDQMGSFNLSLPGIFERDRTVTEWVRDWGAGLVVTLGGGYSRSAWVAHYNYVRYLVSGSTRIAEPEGEGQAIERSFEQVARTLSTAELTGAESMDLSLDESELFGQLAREPQAVRLLDFYSTEGVRVGFERYGIAAKIKERGFRELRTEVDAKDRSCQRVTMHGLKDGDWHRLLELVLRKRDIEIGDLTRTVLHVEWLLLQDPTATFSLDRPPLPGQEHPGLGLSLHVVELLRRICLRLGLAGITNRPAHYHNAAGAPRGFRFVDPKDQGYVRALSVVLSGLPIAEASQLVETGAVRLEDGPVKPWSEISDMLLPLDPDLQAHFRSEAYRSVVVETAQDLLRRGLHPVLEVPNTSVATSSSEAHR